MHRLSRQHLQRWHFVAYDVRAHEKRERQGSTRRRLGLVSLEERAGVEAIKQAVPPRSSCATCWQASLNIRNSVACLLLLQLGSMSLYRYNRLGDGGSCGAARERKRCGGSCDDFSCWELGVWHVGLPGFEAL